MHSKKSVTKTKRMLGSRSPPMASMEDIGYFADEDLTMYDQPAPSDDIWKKFAPLLTPPRSPVHDTCSCESDEVLNLIESDATLQKILCQDELASLESVSSALNILSQDSATLNNMLIQDCMWSTTNAAAKPPVDGFLGAKHATDNNNNTSKSGNTKNSVDINTSDCVDPTSVFPYPLNSKEYKKQPVHVGVETPSDSEEDEEEEIDVVTVEMNSILRRKPQSQSIIRTESSHVAEMHNYSSSVPSYSAPHTPLSHHHNYAGHKRSRPNSSPASPMPHAKKQKLVVSESDLRSVVQKLKMSGHVTVHRRSGCGSPLSSYSRNSSDSEECEGGKRAQHNVLERKRRNDLKYSFIRLRQTVPDLHTNERAPKVTILKKATDYVRQLGKTGHLLDNELARVKATNERLRLRLNVLKRELL